MINEYVTKEQLNFNNLKDIDYELGYILGFGEKAVVVMWILYVM